MLAFENCQSWKNRSLQYPSKCPGCFGQDDLFHPKLLPSFQGEGFCAKSLVLCRAVIAIQKQLASLHRSLYIQHSDLYLQSCDLHPEQVTVTFMLRPRYLVKSLPLCRAAIFIQRPRIFWQDLGSLLKAQGFLANLAVSIGSCAKAYFAKLRSAPIFVPRSWFPWGAMALIQGRVIFKG